MKRLSHIENQRLVKCLTEVILTIVNSGHWNDMDIKFEDFYDWNEGLQVMMSFRFKNEPTFMICKITDQTKFMIEDEINEWEKRNNKLISSASIYLKYH